MMRFFVLSVSFLFIFLMQGCSQKNTNELYNKPAIFWYKQIVKDIQSKDLEQADAHYTSMSSEHVASPLLEQALIILAQAHMEEEEYLLANFYLDLYMKRFGNYANNEYAKYMKIKANFLSFTYPDRNQELLISTIEDIKRYVKAYPNSIYTPLIKSILVKMELGNFYLDGNIEKLYKRTGRENSAQIYKKIVESSSLKDAKMIDPRKPWYRKIFE